jgi:predicted enzyme related to lactoylglutathione lyase
MSARGRPDAAAEKAAAGGGSLLAGRYDLPGFLPAVLSNPSGAAFTVSQLVIGSQGA